MRCPKCALEMVRTEITAALARNGYAQQTVPGWRCRHCDRLAVPNYAKAICRCGVPAAPHSHDWLADRFRLWVLTHNQGMHAVPI